MNRATRRRVPLIVVASASPAVADPVVLRLRRQGYVVLVARSGDGCLRVATSVAPDVVLIDPAWARRIEPLLRAHPASAGAQIAALTWQGLPASVSGVLHAA